MASPRVSVIIPAYNHERFVGAAVESVLAQTMRDLELIVIDDGSGDGTGRVVQGFADPRLRYVWQENADAYNALNHGLRLARGEFVAILNSDDVYALNRLERLLAEQARSGAACLFTDVQPIDATGHGISDPDHNWHRWHRKNREFYFDSGDLYTAFLNGNFMVTTSNLFLTMEAARLVGTFAPLRYLHDYDFIFRVMLACPGRVQYLHDEQLLCYRIHGANTLREAAITGREQDQMVIRKYLLARVPADLQAIVSAGLDRLVELERELSEVRNPRPDPPGPGIGHQAKTLAVSIARRLARHAP